MSSTPCAACEIAFGTSVVSRTEVFAAVALNGSISKVEFKYKSVMVQVKIISVLKSSSFKTSENSDLDIRKCYRKVTLSNSFTLDVTIE